MFRQFEDYDLYTKDDTQSFLVHDRESQKYQYLDTSDEVAEFFENNVDVDEYIELCHALGMKPLVAI